MDLRVNNAKILAQSNPANTTAASLYSPGTRQKAIVYGIVIANVTGSAAAYRLHVDVGGTTYDTGNALAYDVSLAANTSTYLEFDAGIGLEGADSLGIRTNTGNALCFTAYGIVFGGPGSV